MLTTVFGALAAYYAISTSTVAPEPESAVPETAEFEGAAEDESEEKGDGNENAETETTPASSGTWYEPQVVGALVGAAAGVIGVAFGTLRATREAQKVEARAQILGPREQLTEWRRAGVLSISDVDYRRALEIWGAEEVHRIVAPLFNKGAVSEGDRIEVQVDLNPGQQPIPSEGTLHVSWHKAQPV